MSVPNLPPGTKVFRYKLDFYYQQSLLYLETLICYAGIFVLDQFLVEYFLVKVLKLYVAPPLRKARG